jgi:hypothetical protein
MTTKKRFLYWGIVGLVIWQSLWLEGYIEVPSFFSLFFLGFLINAVVIGLTWENT